MAIKRVSQVGGPKEAPPVGVDFNSVESTSTPNERAYTSKDAEFQSYANLLKGCFEKFTRWQAILAADEYQVKNMFNTNDTRDWRGFSVLHSAKGLTITALPDAPAEADYNPGQEPQEAVLYVSKFRYLDDPKRGFFGETFDFSAGPAGRDLLVDSEDGEPLDQVSIDVGMQFDREIKIQTERPSINRNIEPNRYRQVTYRLRGETLTVKHKHVGNGVLTDEMAASLINTIDTLIPGGTSPTYQPDRRTRLETQIPKALPPAPGRLPGRRA